MSDTILTALVTRAIASRKETYVVILFADVYIPSWFSIVMDTLEKSKIIIDTFTNFTSSKSTVVTAGQI